MKWKVERKCAIITGAASGIGRALALELTRRNVHVCLVDRDADKLQATATACRQFDVLVEDFAVDLTEPDAPARIYQHVLSTMGGLDVLINNAGVGYYGSFEPMSAEQIETLLSVNLNSALQLTNTLLPLLLQNERAHVQNVSSIYAMFPTRRSAAYHASKYGMLGFSLALRAEYARYGLGVSCLCPGFVRTELFDNMLLPEHQHRPAPPNWLTTSPERAAKRAVRAMQRNQRIATVTWLDWAIHRCSWLATPLLDLLNGLERRRPHEFAKRQLKQIPMPLDKVIEKEGFPPAGQHASNGEAGLATSPISPTNTTSDVSPDRDRE
ncbi:SDR family NAD(P)-dependent oxidoreductase [Rubinisphaera brasiliensis]|uniref:Estradiol 17-beta-dehydrogenase n=1 Tax=Rubinisphaera brasiliensis (strain ATCC 49424 / DSM 5305 / JCM 21570 / IAM 15109 / NBRC 103401 / IFAM 1448) TaxID=756272 RepID=F0SK61_RUBBR|nr:SDR family NAD(P)-dependent oxidoreductase [Rubinisphaera brasiliensis]ADY59788.1 Estradiol 17-beta-dehydrogenase [Rubinisphaera brasiliensis DSM 5305]